MGRGFYDIYGHNVVVMHPDTIERYVSEGSMVEVGGGVYTLKFDRTVPRGSMNWRREDEALPRPGYGFQDMRSDQEWYKFIHDNLQLGVTRGTELPRSRAGEYAARFSKDREMVLLGLEKYNFSGHWNRHQMDRGRKLYDQVLKDFYYGPICKQLNDTTPLLKRLTRNRKGDMGSIFAHVEITNRDQIKVGSILWDVEGQYYTKVAGITKAGNKHLVHYYEGDEGTSIKGAKKFAAFQKTTLLVQALDLEDFAYSLEKTWTAQLTKVTDRLGERIEALEPKPKKKWFKMPRLPRRKRCDCGCF